MPESNSRAILAYLFAIDIFLNILNFKQGNHSKFALSLAFLYPSSDKKQVELDFT